jgi:Flp pilus assembly protein TadG
VTNRTTARVGGALRALRSSTSGNIITEFALVSPILFSMTIGGVEVANYTMVSTRISTLAVQVADNTSRIGEGSLLAALRINERNINDVLAGAGIQSGSLDIYGNYSERVGGVATTSARGRIIISSLVPTANPNTTGTYRINWQRCRGGLTSYTPQYGVVGQPSGTNMAGMGPAGRQVTVPDGNSIIFVEVRYRYEPVFNIGWQRAIFNNGMNYQNVDAIAAMIVRDDRDVTQIYNPDSATVATC